MKELDETIQQLLVNLKVSPSAEVFEQTNARLEQLLVTHGREPKLIEALQQVWKAKNAWKVQQQRLHELDETIKELQPQSQINPLSALRRLLQLKEKYFYIWQERHENLLSSLQQQNPRQEPLILVFRDVNPEVVQGWLQFLRPAKEVSIGSGSVLQADIDAVVSPANSFGYMDGGIDLAYRNFFGLGIQTRLQLVIEKKFGGELPVGQAVCIPTGHGKITRLVAAPTMRTPQRIIGTDNVYKAMKAAFQCALQVRPEIKRLGVPGLGTGVGELDPFISAEQIYRAYIEVLGGGA